MSFGSGRVLGVDTGGRRVGLARSDALRITARAAGAVDADGAVETIAGLIEPEEIEAVVVGLPLNMDGTKGESALRAEAFARTLAERTGLPVALWDERLTTRQADRAMIAADLSRKKRKKRIDGQAAQIILQSWLDAGCPGLQAAE
jgi:putative Holliday junction resolvase